MENIEFYWNVTKMEVLPKFGKFSNVVKRVTFQVTGKDPGSGEISALAGETLLLEPKKETFTPYFDLTEELVIKMVKKAIGERAVYDFEQEIKDNLISIVEPDCVEMNLPWVEDAEDEDKVVLFKTKK